MGSKRDMDRARQFTAYLKEDVENEVIIHRYSETSKDYEENMGAMNFRSPFEIGVTLSKLFKDNRRDVRILDIAAGTGLCGLEFYKYGFRHIDALDPAEGMLEEAKKKHVYTNFFFDFLADKRLDLFDNSYDTVTICGLCSNILRKLPWKAFEELTRIVKPGGYVVIAGALSSFEEGEASSKEFRQKISTLESSGKWENVELRKFQSYIDNTEGAISVHCIIG